MRQLLPYAFARDHQLLLEDDGQQLTLWVCTDSDRSALSEVLRLHGSGQPQWQHLPTAALTQRVQQAYAHAQTDGTGSAAAVVSEVESAADLSRMMQALPAVEDLLEASDDAPIIRMLNALLTQAARDGASDIHINPTNATPACAFVWTARCARWCNPTARCTLR